MKIPASQSYGTPANVFHHKISPSASLALRFQQKWMALHPQDTCNSGGNLDDSLTSLGWLQNLKVSEFTQLSQISGQNSGTNSNRGFFTQEPQVSIPNIASLQTTVLEPRLQVGDTAPSYGTFRGTFDYKSNPYVKPPYSYTSLICMAMQATKKSKITLSCIYNWIKENFVYYRHSDPSWQNSIRHNLSLNKCFEKVARQKDEPGKGGFWRINPEYGSLVDKGIIKKRRGSWDSVLFPPLKRLKLKEDNTPRVSGMKSNARDDKLLSNSFIDHDIADNDENSLTLKNDLDWLSVFNQDIKFSGSTVIGRDIQDDTDNSPFMTMSPPSSETNSDDLGLELFSHIDLAMGFPVDFHTNDPLDLTVQGTVIRPPDWWSIDGNSNVVNINNKHGTTSSLNTPSHPSGAAENRDTIWGESLELGSSSNNFDLDILFEFDNMQNQK